MICTHMSTVRKTVGLGLVRSFTFNILCIGLCWFSLDYFVRVLFGLVVLDLVSSAPCGSGPGALSKWVSV